jgi:Uma2 family endonuclease
MSNPARRPTRMTPEEYLRFEDAASERHEFVDGAVYGMAGASTKHNYIAGNLYGLLRANRRPGCQVFMSDMRLKVSAAGEDYFYPDVMVTCAETDVATHVKEMPSVVIEVASSSTAGMDRGDKRLAYQAIASLEEYLIVSQDMAEVEIFRRRADWVPVKIKTGPVVIESQKLSLDFDQIYQDVTF